MKVIANRFNTQRIIGMLQPYGCKFTLDNRWQVSLIDKRGRVYDYYFTAKPTKKQLRQLKRVRPLIR